MYLFFLAFGSYACSVDNNIDGIINPDCNWAGTCVQSSWVGVCKCCDYTLDDNPCGDALECDPQNPTTDCYLFDGTSCEYVLNAQYVNFGFRAENTSPAPPNMVCSTIPEERAQYNIYGNLSVDISSYANEIAQSRGWNGTLKPVPECDTCSDAHPCLFQAGDNEGVTEGIRFAYQIDLNEYYDKNCFFPNIVASTRDYPECAANYDYGVKASQVWDSLIDDREFMEAFNDLLWSQAGLGWNNTRLFAAGSVVQSIAEWEWILSRAPTEYPTVDPTESPTVVPTRNPTAAPTSSPTQRPTASPTQSPTALPTSSPSQTPTAAPTSPPTQSPTASPTQSPTALPTKTPTQSPTVSPTSTPTQSPTASPTSTPTQSPTAHPTAAPTLTPTGMQCAPYSNNINDIHFLRNAAHCRAGLDMSYPGGLSCDSPYIVCLPQENTPAQFGYEPYYSSTHRYSEEECKQECANDQRCRGVEFSADYNSTRGNCTLIDDIPVVSEPSISGPEVKCFVKTVQCYPFFEADDLNATMLNCYCPNNRKGFYTKKVKRTVENTRFCDYDTDIEERIRKAQANRMFHLCENWCLFDTENPTEEYWFWDPWKTCWREQQEAASSYCTHIIEDPLTIEMQFLIDRRKHFCELNGTVYE